MIVDLMSLVVLAILTYLGWRSGLLRQLIRVVAIIAVFVAVPTVTPLVKSIFFRESGASTPWVEVLSLGIAAAVIYFSIVLAGWIILKAIRFVSRALGCLDSAGGASLGAAKGVLIIYLFVTLVVLLEVPLTESDPENKLRLREGRLTAVVTHQNVLAPWQFPDLNRLHQALRFATKVEEEGLHRRVRDDDGITTILRDQRFKVLHSDEEFMAWVEADSYPFTLADARVRELLNDREFSRALSFVEWDALSSADSDEEFWKN